MRALGREGIGGLVRGFLDEAGACSRDLPSRAAGLGASLMWALLVSVGGVGSPTRRTITTVAARVPYFYGQSP